MATLGELEGKITIDGAGADKVIDLINKKLDTLTDNAVRAGKSADGFGFSLNRVGEIAGGIISANIFTRIATGIWDIANAVPQAAMGALDLASNLQEVAVSLGVLLGDQGKAKTLLKDLAQFASATPFSLVDLQKYTKQLIAAGFASEDIITTLEALGDTASAVGMDNLPFLIKAFGDVRVAGKFAGTELIQFRNAGINLETVFREKLGKSVEEVNAAIADGTLKYKDAEDAILSLGRAGGRFDGLMENISKNTLTGLTSNLNDLKDQFLATVGGFNIATGEVIEGGFLDKVQTGVRDLIEYLSSDEGSKQLQSLGTSLSELFGNIGEFAIKVVQEYLPRIVSFVKDELVPGFLNFTKSLVSSWPQIVLFVETLISSGRQTVQIFQDLWGVLVGVFNTMKNIVDLMNFNSPTAWQDRIRNDFNAYAEQQATQNKWTANTGITPMAPNGKFPGFAQGTSWFGGGAALVGENGPELVNLPRGASVMSNSRLQNGGAGGAGGANIVNNNYFSNGLDIATFNDKMNFQLKIY